MSVLEELDRVVEERLRTMPEGSYTAHLASRGLEYVARKLGEEAVETIVAALSEDGDRLAEEAADLLYTLTVLMRVRGMSIVDALEVLRGRMG
ncbi:MAG: phosphoribosyl-ATP diphosphatase [Desulfurococcales archaeon]|nr:phosphoribosyl-ATP diphosphatase [Desulfurococcales archaeon]